MIGRPTKISPAIRAKIMEGIISNLPYDMCAWRARISEKTLYNWLERGRKDFEKGEETEWSHFLQDIKEAESVKVAQHLHRIEDCVERWQALMTLLERRWRQYFGQDAAQLEELRKIYEYLKEKDKKDEK